MNKLFKNVGSLQPGKSMFDLSYEKKFSCDMGQLIPIMADEVVPGDIFTIGNNAVIRFQPLVAPVLHEINVYVHYFFVPYRLLWDEWETFITGGVTGDEVPTMPTWNPGAGENVEGTLWDYLGFPTGVDPDGAYPIDLPRRAYYFIYNEYYRDETLIAEIDITGTDYTILNRAWEKDYFTSALTFQQRGTGPAFPIVGSTTAEWDPADIIFALSDEPVRTSNTAARPWLYSNNVNSRQNLEDFLASNTVDLSTAAPIDISDLRLGFQVQKWMERNARAGARYTEFLGSHFGVKPTDERLDRPEYIGGSKFPVIISEVLQTSESNTTAQGTLAGHGISVNADYVAKYRATEFGIIMGIMSVMPRPAYQQGINRQWLRYTKFDFYFPEFAHISEQGIIRAEIYANGVSADNNTLFGYCGAYDEMRTKQSIVCGEFRSTYDYWHIGRQFGAAPTLNQTFIECVPRKDIFAAPSEPGLLVQFGNLIKAIRPMPIISEPGLIDHF